jgi:hypothetical protein
LRDFVTKFDGGKMKDMDQYFGRDRNSEEFLIGLGALRAVFGQQIALLSHMYAIDLEEQLAGILPPIPEVDENQSS